MEEFKGTKGEFTYSAGYGHIVMVNGKFFCHCSGDEDNPKLICEAFNVVTRTGLTPEQMDDRLLVLKCRSEIDKEEISDLEARLKEAVELIEKIKTPWGKTRIGDEITSFLTKEKTK